MTMQTGENSAPEPQQPAAATPEPAAPATPEPPSEPLTPGEAAKQARINAEANARLARAKRQSDKLYREKKEWEAAQKQREEEREAERKAWAEEKAAINKKLEELSSGNPLLRKDLTHEQRGAYIRELVEQGTPEGEVVALKRIIEKQAKEFEEYKQSQTAASKAREEEEQRRIAAARQGEEENKLRQFTLWATGDEGKKQFKFLNAEYTQTEVLQQTAAIVDWAKKNNKVYSGQEIAEYLEARAQKVHNERAERRGFLLGATPPPAPAAVTPPSKVAPPVSGKKPPVQVRQKTKEEEEEADKAALRRAFAADAAAASGKKK